MPRQASSSTPHLWAQADDDLLCAMVVEYGPNWTLIADTLSTTSAVQGVNRRPEWCKARYAVLQKTPMDVPDGQEPPRSADGLLISYASISKQQVR